MGVNWNNINRSGARASRNSNAETKSLSLWPNNVPLPIFQAGTLVNTPVGEGVVTFSDSNMEGIVFVMVEGRELKYRIKNVSAVE